MAKTDCSFMFSLYRTGVSVRATERRRKKNNASKTSTGAPWCHGVFREATSQANKLREDWKDNDCQSNDLKTRIILISQLRKQGPCFLAGQDSLYIFMCFTLTVRKINV